jgi:23S rRNA (cytidine1920-2'-O)/16S rRNA (cytidine1409-2'-O)-methyltransferase
LVVAGRVLVSGSVAEKSSRLVGRGEPLVIETPRRFVSRGGEKLEAALEEFGLQVSDRICLDAGASTGGFTDCLLQSGADRVWAVDAGHGHMAPELRSNPRVVVVEGCNIRHATLESLGTGPFGFVTADLSFISLRTVARKLATELAQPGAEIVVLVKPQFEAERSVVDRGRGVVRDPSEWRDALLRVGTAFAAAGAAIIGVMPSPIVGPAGNVEFLVHLRAGSPTEGALHEASGLAVDRAVERAVDRQTARPAPEIPPAPSPQPETAPQPARQVH